MLQCLRLVLDSRPVLSPLSKGLVLVSDWVDSGFLIKTGWDSASSAMTNDSCQESSCCLILLFVTLRDKPPLFWLIYFSHLIKQRLLFLKSALVHSWRPLEADWWLEACLGHHTWGAIWDGFSSKHQTLPAFSISWWMFYLAPQTRWSQFELNWIVVNSFIVVLQLSTTQCCLALVHWSHRSVKIKRTVNKTLSNEYELKHNW